MGARGHTGGRGVRGKLAEPAGRATYAYRNHIVEPGFGQIKEARRFRRVSFRGVARVTAEWAVICSSERAARSSAWRQHHGAAPAAYAGAEPLSGPPRG